MTGWISVHRKLLDSDLWKCETFTRGQAWIDLLLLANHSETFFYKRGNKVTVKRGQVGRSQVELSDRWNWSRSKVRKFLNDLEKEQQIIQHKTTVTQILTVINYDYYQNKEQQTSQQKDSRRTAEEQQEDTYNKGNKGNNDNKRIYRSFNDLKITVYEFSKLAEDYRNGDIDEVLDSIENYKGNKKYTSLYLTAKKWLNKDYTKKSLPQHGHAGLIL